MQQPWLWSMLARTHFAINYDGYCRPPAQSFGLVRNVLVSTLEKVPA